jgi:hypothetical protein
MDWWRLNLIHLFDLYLAVLCVLAIGRRLEQYQAIGGLLFAGPTRWPRLIRLVQGHRAIFYTGATLRPLLVVGGVWLLQIICSRLIWPQAQLTVGTLPLVWPAVFLLLPLGIAMAAFDGYTLWQVGVINRADLEKQLDQAEFWLCDWKAPVVRVLTFGYVDPRRMVDAEVRKGLELLGGMLNRSLWWVAAQVGLRVSFGVALWLTWAWLAGPPAPAVNSS